MRAKKFKIVLSRVEISSPITSAQTVPNITSRILLVENLKCLGMEVEYLHGYPNVPCLIEPSVYLSLDLPKSIFIYSPFTLHNAPDV